MTAATTPETGNSTVYFYYTTSGGSLCSGDSSELCRRTDPKGITTTYSYDALNRLTGKSYSGGNTPSSSYSYDSTSCPVQGVSNYGKGRMTGMSDGSGSTSWCYDADGRVLAEKRTIAGVTKTTQYAYNLDGSVSSVSYPSGHTVTYNVGNAGRALSAIDSGSNIQYALTASYAPQGAVSSIIYGKVTGGFGGITEQRSYNGRLELSTVQASSSAGGAENLTYNYPSSANNGSVSSITNSLNTGLSESFTYDSLNRVLSGATSSSSASGCWGQSFGPSGTPPPGPPEDRYGNLTTINLTQCSSGSLSVTVNASTNQITTSGFAYDSDGNMTQDGSGYTYTFDAENRLTQASGMSGGPWNYTYDGNSLRVKKSNSSGGALYWRSIWGDALAESDLQGNITNEYVFMAGRRIARRDSSGHVYYYYPDALGSPMTITDSSGNPCYVASYTPYGQEMATTNTCPQNYKYTGYEQDAETGLYYAFARYYSPRLGRFLSPDPLAGDISNPQSLNRYAYVANNPLNAVDPRGMECGPVGDGLVLACEETGGGGGGGDGVNIIGAMTGAFLGYFSAANGNMGMSGRDFLGYMNNQFMRAVFGDSYYDVPGYANPKEQDEGVYLQTVAEGLSKLIIEGLKKGLRAALCDPNCAELFGSVPSAMAMADKMTIVDTTAAGWTSTGIQDDLGLNELKALAGRPSATVFPTYGNTSVWDTRNGGGYKTYLGQPFWDIDSTSGRTTVLIHEMSHPYTSAPTRGYPDQPGSLYSYENISQQCDTAVPTHH